MEPTYNAVVVLTLPCIHLVCCCGRHISLSDRRVWVLDKKALYRASNHCRLIFFERFMENESLPLHAVGLQFWDPHLDIICSLARVEKHENKVVSYFIWSIFFDEDTWELWYNG